MPERDDLDGMLDAALTTYGDPGPDSGLEQRVLARVAAEAAPSPLRRWLPWAIALPVAACLLILVMSRPRISYSPDAHSTGVNQASEPAAARPVPQLALQPAPARRGELASKKSRPHSVAIAAKSAPLPKLDVFPTPQPLTPQEQVLVAFATQAPESERKALLEMQKQMSEPIRIAAIHIPPLEPPAPGAN
ncbi:MAG: hypothetical protein RB191_03505 [Terriglobia bacterium]|nr:hypothetical protein [Terriglobia bacterium]